MPWKWSTPLDERLEFVQAALQSPPGCFSSICREHSISRRTGYKWLARFRQDGGSALVDRDRTPHQQPCRVSAEVAGQICQLRQEHPLWGARKLRHRLLLDDPGGPWPTWRTVHRVLRRHHLIPPPTAAPPPPRRFERAAPNELWQMDLKGWFHIAGQGRCYPITLLDDHSRFCLGIGMARHETQAAVWQFLEQAFDRYGLPQAILTDHGPTFWGSSSDQGLCRFQIQLYKLGVRHYTGRPRHPQTQGKIERFHRTLQDEVLHRIRFGDHQDAQRHIDVWIDQYNGYRPHEALGGQVPAHYYHPSEVPYVGIPEIVYPPGSILCRVNQQGMMRYRGKDFFISKALRGEMVQLLPVGSQRHKIYFKELYIRNIKA
jgi:transposase InsO family protein